MDDETKTIIENGDSVPPKSAKQLAKEAAKQAKLDKLKQKLDKQQNTASKKDREEVNIMFACVFEFCMILLGYRKRRKRKTLKNLLYMSLIHQLVKKKMLQIHYQMLTVQNMLKLHGTVGGKNKVFSNLNMV